jgi:hypothetical protein
MRSWGVLVGRVAELAALNKALDSIGAGEGHVVLLGGEPGIGKTRLVRELTRSAVERRVPVVAGRALAEEGTQLCGRGGRPCSAVPSWISSLGSPNRRPLSRSRVERGSVPSKKVSRR